MKVPDKLVEQLNAIHIDRIAVDRTYDLALTFHKTCVAQIEVQSKQLWDNIVAELQLDPEKNWTLVRTHNGFEVKEAAE